MHKGITKEVIFKESERMLRLHGLDDFSVRALSANLGIKPASLYNHINGIDEIYNHIAKKSAEMMTERLSKAMANKSRDEAFLSGAKAYLKFAEQKREYYLILIKIRNSKNEEISKLGLRSFAPMTELIKSYGCSKEETLHFLRCFRAFLHGFIEMSYNGFMQRGPISKYETFEFSVNGFLKVLNGGIKR